MTDPTEDFPRLAKPGEVRGFTTPTTLVEKYKLAAKLALDHANEAVLVEAYGHDGTKDGDEGSEAARRSAAAVTKVQLPALNEWDRGEGHDGATERFHVGYSNNEEQQAVLTFVVFYPDGRPKRQRAEKADDVAADEAPPAE